MAITKEAKQQYDRERYVNASGERYSKRGDAAPAPSFSVASVALTRHAPIAEGAETRERQNVTGNAAIICKTENASLPTCGFVTWYNKRIMGSIAAAAVAREVLETIGKGEKPHLGKILRAKGYSEATSLNPQMVTATESYKEVVNPVVVALEKERQAIIKTLSRKRGKAQYHHLIDGLDKLTKNIQLLSGKSTENIATKVVVTFRD